MAKYTLENLPCGTGKYRVIAVDLDDTLLRSDKTISSRTKQAMQEAQKQGFAIAITTGRHPKSAVRYMNELGCLNEHSFAVCFNGAAVICLKDFIAYGKNTGYPEVYCDIVKGSMIKKLVAFAHEQGCSVHAYSRSGGLLIENFNPYSMREIRNSGVEYHVTDFLSRSDSEEFYKMLIVSEEHHLDRTRAKLCDDFINFFSVVRSDPNFLEFIPNHATKGSALGHLCQALGCGIDNAVAFGDAENDLAMIKAAGLGVAMGNGYQIVKDAADVVTVSNDDDGVARVIEKLLDK